LVFHWDEKSIQEYAARYRNDRVIWARGIGDTNGEAVYEAAANAITNSVLPDDPDEPDTPRAECRTDPRIDAECKCDDEDHDYVFSRLGTKNTCGW
jgi:hypothetical protein